MIECAQSTIEIALDCPTMLHIHNGDSSAATARSAQIPGEHLAWREALVCGPAPEGLPLEEFIEVRAAHLAEAYKLPVEKCAAELSAMHDALARFADHEEIVLWFEHDLFCQVHLIYLLNWFTGRTLQATKLSMISIDQFPGVTSFHGLGELNEEQLLSLWPQRKEISAAELELGAKAWEAYASPNALKLISLLRTDLSALPFLRSALLKHVERFPSIRNGLGRVENACLSLIAAGQHKFKKLFPAFSRREPQYGFGDAQVYLTMRRLTDAGAPLLTQSDGGDSRTDSARILVSSFEITERGVAAIAGEEDFVANNGIDLWLGGIHLQGRESGWRWDEDHRELLVSF